MAGAAPVQSLPQDTGLSARNQSLVLGGEKGGLTFGKELGPIKNMSTRERQLMLFGPIPGLTDNDPYHDQLVSHRMLPESFNQLAANHIIQRIYKRIQDVQQWMYKDILPLKVYEGGKTFKVTRVMYESERMDMLPDQGVPRVLTQRYEEWFNELSPYGLGFIMEGGYRCTDDGVRDYLINIESLAVSWGDTATTSGVYALLAASAPENWFEQFGVTPDKHTLNNLYDKECALFGVLSKPRGSYVLKTIIDDVFSYRNVEPDTMIVTKGALDNYNINHWDEMEFYREGPRGPAERESSTAVRKRFPWTIYELKRYVMQSGQMPEDLLETGRTIGEANFFDHSTHEDIDPKNYKSVFMNYWAYNWATDRMQQFKFIEHIKASPLFMPDGRLSPQLGVWFFTQRAPKTGTFGEFLHSCGIERQFRETVKANLDELRDANGNLIRPMIPIPDFFNLQNLMQLDYMNDTLGSRKGALKKKQNGILEHVIRQMQRKVQDSYFFTPETFMKEFAKNFNRNATRVEKQWNAWKTKFDPKTNGVKTSDLDFIVFALSDPDYEASKADIVTKLQGANWGAGDISDKDMSNLLQTQSNENEHVFPDYEDLHFKILGYETKDAAPSSASNPGLRGPSQQSGSTKQSEWAYLHGRASKDKRVQTAAEKLDKDGNAQEETGLALASGLLAELSSQDYKTLGVTEKNVIAVIDNILLEKAAEDLVRQVFQTTNGLNYIMEKARFKDGAKTASFADFQLSNGGDVYSEPNSKWMQLFMNMPVRYLRREHCEFFYHNNIWMPFNGMNARPHIYLLMASIIVLLRGDRTGNTLHNFERFILSHDGKRDQLFGRLAVWLGPVVHHPEHVLNIQNARYVDHVAGGDSEYFTPFDRVDREIYINGDFENTRKSIFAIPMYCDEMISEDKFFDITGQFPPGSFTSQARSDTLHFAMASHAVSVFGFPPPNEGIMFDTSIQRKRAQRNTRLSFAYQEGCSFQNGCCDPRGSIRKGTGHFEMHCDNVGRQRRGLGSTLFTGPPNSRGVVVY